MFTWLTGTTWNRYYASEQTLEMAACQLCERSSNKDGCYHDIVQACWDAGHCENLPLEKPTQAT